MEAFNAIAFHIVQKKDRDKRIEEAAAQCRIRNTNDVLIIALLQEIVNK